MSHALNAGTQHSSADRKSASTIAVLAVEVLHDRQLDLLAALFVHRFARHRADQHVQAFALDDLGRLFGHLLRRKMRQQVGDDELRVIRLVAHTHLYRFHLPVMANADHAAQLERNRRPLVLFDTAIVMRLEKCHAAVLIERHGADIDARCVEMGSGQAHALGNVLFCR